MSLPSIEQLRFHQLKKHHLFRDSSFEGVARDLMGLHSTDYWTPYLSVWSRIGDYDASKVFKNINSGKGLARINAYRRTLHVVHVDDLPLIIRATASVFYNSARKVPPLRNSTDVELKAVINKILVTLEDGPLKMSELKKKVPEMEKLGRWVLLLPMAEGKVIRAHANHARSNLTAYALTEKWIKGYKPSEFTEDEAIREIIQRYIKAYGPVTKDDVTWWLMLTKTKIGAILKILENHLQTIEIDGSQYFVDPKTIESCINEEEDIPEIWFLPYEDVFPKAYIKREWYLDNDLKRKIFPESSMYFWPPNSPEMPPEKHKGMNQAGEIRPTIWFEGKIVGRWEIQEQKGTYTVISDIYRKMKKDVLESINEKRGELEEFINKRLAPISGK